MNFNLGLSPNQYNQISNRKVYVLDTSVWNRLADRKTKETIDISEQLEKEVNKGKIFCPLTPTNILELRKQTGKSLFRTALLMEKLSLNVAFRQMDQIIDFEIEHFLKYVLTESFVPLSNKELFGSLFSYISPSFKLKNITQETYNLSKALGEKVKNLSVTEYVTILGEKSFPIYRKTSSYQAQNIKRRNEANGSKNKMRRIEIEYIAKNIVVPKLNSKRSLLPIKDQLLIVQKVKNLPMHKKYGTVIDRVLPFLPLVSAYIDIMTVSGYDINRKDNDNDFFDREIMIYALSYSGVFSAIDKGIKDIMNMVTKEGNIGGLCYVSSLKELKEKL